MTTFLKPDSSLTEEGLLLNAKLAIETPDGIFLNLEVDRFLSTARRYKCDGLKILYKALAEKFGDIPTTKPTAIIPEVKAKFTCPNCKRNFSSQSALSGHRPQKCNGTFK